MINEEISKLITKTEGHKIIQVVIDGVGGVPDPETGQTEMEMAKLPNLDRLAATSSSGLMEVIAPGVTPGSGPAHLSLFGYHPFQVTFGRGALEALGSDFDLRAGDVATRANFATIDAENIVQDRRAGRPSDEENRQLCKKLLAGFEGGIEGREVFILPGKEHRFTVVFRGQGLDPSLDDMDPQREGRPFPKVSLQRPEAELTGRIVEVFLERARKILAGEPRANGMLLRGFSGLPEVMPFPQRYGMKAGAIAAYPMYRGVARLVGMEVLGVPKNVDEELALLEEKYSEYDFFYFHYKGTDSAGHAGDFTEKVKHLEKVDSIIPRIEKLQPEVLIITGDHCTPCAHKEHSWHPVPTLLHSPLGIPRKDAVYTERGLAGGDLGTFHATDLMVLALAHASRLDKFGA